MRALRQVGLAWALAGCAPEPTSAAWFTSTTFDWAFFNHRLTGLGVRPTAEGMESVFVGGASTTATIFEDTAECLDSATCFEIPVVDPGLVSALRVSATVHDAVVVSTRVTLDANAGSAEVQAELTLPWQPSGDVHAWIGGFGVVSGAPDSTASCYDHRYGWLPRRVRLGLGEPSVEGSVVTVPVQATFAAGLTFEAQRACLDAVAGAATARFEVDVVASVGVTASALSVSQGAAWPDADTPQLLSDVGELSAAFEGVPAWRAFDFRFHTVVDAERGAYLRSVALQAGDGEAYGFASNTSLTALSGFDYSFEGELLDLDLADEVAYASFEDDARDALLDEQTGAPVWTDLPATP